MSNRWPHSGAFVLRLGPDADPEAGRFEGRIEHVFSGRVAPFHGLEELRAFLAEVLAELRAGEAEASQDPPPGPPGSG